MTRDQIGYLWRLISQSWGQKFSEQYGPDPNPAWLAALEHMTVDAGRHAYVTALRETPTFPPTLPEFLAWADGYRPTSSTRALPAPAGTSRPRSIDDLRGAAGAEVAAFSSYRDYEAWRAANTKRGQKPPHPTPGSPDWLYLQRLAWIQAGENNRRTVESVSNPSFAA